MTNLIKTILLILSITLSMAFISCQNNDKTGDDGSFKNSDLAGTWTSGGNSFTIDSSGKVNFTYQGYTHNGLLLHDMESESYGTGSSIYDSSYMAATSFSNGNKIQLARFYFSSSSSCTVYIRKNTYSSSSKDRQLGVENSIGAFTK